MGLAVRPILMHLCLLSSPLLFLLLFFLLCSILTFAGNLPSSPYFPDDDDSQFQACRCFESSAGVADVVPHTRTSNSSRTKILKIFLYFGQGNAIATAFIMVITLLNVVAFKLRELQEAKSEETSKPALSLSCRKFSLAEIKLTTQNFDEGLVIGKGGFGKVYKGLINHGASVVAVKRLDLKSKQGASEFWTEIKMLSKLRHSHLVSLFGYCNDFDEMILVYEHVACGSLADRLHKFGKSNGPSSLSWVQRLKICLGAARGLDYLHTSTGGQHRVIHRDVKSSNILLDENWCAKISDFGVSKVGPLNQPWTYVSTDVKGSFGYFDPEYFLTRRLTRKSDVYSFGVVLFEVLFGRPAVDLSREEEQRGLAGWALNCIEEGIVEENIDPNLRGQILPNCLMLYVQIAGQCLQNLPRKRPTMSEIVFKLESALALQEITDYSLVEGRVEAGDIYDNQAKEKNSMAEDIVAGNGESKTGAISGTTQSRLGDASSRKSLTKSAASIPFSRKLQQFFSAKAHVDSEGNVAGNGDSKTGVIDESTHSRLGDARSKKSIRKSAVSIPFSRKLRQVFTAKAHAESGISTNTSNGGGFPATTNNSAGQSQLSMAAGDETWVGGEILPAPNLKIYTFANLKSATKNFNSDLVLGEGGFGTVFKGWVDEKTLMPVKYGTGLMIVAIKKLSAESMQGFEEWQSEVNFLGRLSHPNLVKLIGYCWEDKDLLLVYEFMQKGSLENHLFRTGSTAVEPLSWSVRLKIAIGAARGLWFLHSSEKRVIYRDFKASNILLDGNYNAKLSDFGLAKMGPSWGMSHVTTRIMGTYGYAAPEYVATGHLYVKSDVYGFGVVLLEILSGLRALDTKRPSAQHNLIDWAKPFLTHRRKLKTIMDARMEGQYSSNAAFQAAQLTVQCLESEPRKRPSMKEVVQILEHIDSLKAEIKPKSVSSHPSTICRSTYIQVSSHH